ncbi:MAG: hypothetical protein HC822_10890 [Oscillochloris sp.]|nr:hypothetical protein [Oscillochloris sp.]
MTERERERDRTSDDLKSEYPGAPAVRGPTRDDPEVHGNMRVEPVNERPIGGSAKSFDAPEHGAKDRRVVWVSVLIGLLVILLIVLVWALSVLIPFGV